MTVTRCRQRKICLVGFLAFVMCLALARVASKYYSAIYDWNYLDRGFIGDAFRNFQTDTATAFSVASSSVVAQGDVSDNVNNDQQDKPTAIVFDSVPTSISDSANQAGKQTPSAISSADFAYMSDISYHPGYTVPPPHRYSRAIVVPHTSKEDVTWLAEFALKDPFTQVAVYTVDKPVSPYILPANKGHEAMTYLTYVIDFYDRLPDAVIMIHGHMTSWHNNWFLDMNSATMLQRLNIRKVVRDGYMNLRCHREPGCPNHLYPIAKNGSIMDTPEEAVYAEAWEQLLPYEPVPEVVSQPCCSQLAVSRERIRALPRAQYVHFRQWLMYTTLEDRVSGRIWEYLWQYIWTGKAQFCPAEHACYCDAYGICFGGAQAYQQHGERRVHVQGVMQLAANQAREGGNFSWPVDYEGAIKRMQAELEAETNMATERGKDAKSRAMEVGRVWKEGDGF